MTTTFMVLEDSTDTLVTYPPTQWQLVPSSPDVRIGTTSTSLPAIGSEEAATVDAVSASTNAAALEGAESLSFAGDPSCTAERLYLLSHDDIDNFTVRAKSTGTTVRLQDPLPADVPSGATLSGLAITHALTAAETSESGPASAFWQATIGGVVRGWSQKFRIFPRAFAQKMTGPDLELLAPQIARNLAPTADPFLVETIAGGYEWMLSDLEERGYLTHLIYTPEKLNTALANVILWKRYADIEGPASENALEARSEYHSALDGAVRKSEHWYNRGATDAVPDSAPDSGWETTTEIIL